MLNMGTPFFFQKKVFLSISVSHTQTQTHTHTHKHKHARGSLALYETKNNWSTVSSSSADEKTKDLANSPWPSELVFPYSWITVLCIYIYIRKKLRHMRPDCSMCHLRDLLFSSQQSKLFVVFMRTKWTIQFVFAFLCHVS
jgi:hypothetical protein